MTADTPATAPIRPRYYRWFASYEIPFRPTEEVEFADTEGLWGYCSAYKDRTGRVIRFDKWNVFYGEQNPREVKLPKAQPPETAVYFEVVRDPATGEASIGKQIEYVDTELLDQFFAGRVDPSGQTCQGRLLHRARQFSDTYVYWPNGEMKTRIMTKAGQSPVARYYDPEGREIAAPLPEPAVAEAPAEEVFEGHS
jgi:hypothetical protein